MTYCPKISIILPVYNGGEYLRKSIDSILSQIYTNFELIIINDGSTDDSINVINSYQDERIIVISHNNIGLAKSLNKGIEISQSDYIARMDQDDISLPERLEKQINFLIDNQEYVLVGSNATIIDEEVEYIYDSNLPIEFEKIKSNFPNSSFFHSSVMFKKDAFYLAGKYFTETDGLYGFEDAILWNKMALIGKMANLQDKLIQYRLIHNSITTKSGKEAEIATKILHEVIKTNKLSTENKQILVGLKSKLTENLRKYNYYILLCKKHLWNNYNPVKARNNIFKALKYQSFKAEPLFLLFASFLPNRIIQFIYNFKK